MGAATYTGDSVGDVFDFPLMDCRYLAQGLEADVRRYPAQLEQGQAPTFERYLFHLRRALSHDDEPEKQ